MQFGRPAWLLNSSRSNWQSEVSKDLVRLPCRPTGCLRRGDKQAWRSLPTAVNGDLEERGGRPLANRPEQNTRPASAAASATQLPTPAAQRAFGRFPTRPSPRRRFAAIRPVLSPPWSLHRPFAMAGHWQGAPRLFLAPQRRTCDRSPGGLPFFSHPRRRSWGVSRIFSTVPTVVSPLGNRDATALSLAYVYVD